jgi:Asp-tRNA(Asn)/Glu-tRNA(Gln) amidotransferase A subunit family amidase
VAAKPSAREIRIGRLRLKGTDREIDQAVDEALAKTGFQVIPLDDSFREEWARAEEDGTMIAAAGAWISDKEFRFERRVAARTKTAIRAGQIAYATGYESAVARQAEWQNTLKGIFTNVDFIALPTLQTPPPPIPPNLKIGVMEARMLQLQNTVAVNFAGNPAVALPIPLHYDAKVAVTRVQSPASLRSPLDREMYIAKVAVTSLQLVGPRLSEAQLLNAGRLVEAAVKMNGENLAAP